MFWRAILEVGSSARFKGAICRKLLQIGSDVVGPLAGGCGLGGHGMYELEPWNDVGILNPRCCRDFDLHNS